MSEPGPRSGTNYLVAIDVDDGCSELAKAEVLGLDVAMTERVAALLVEARRDEARVWEARLERALSLQRELRKQRDEAEALLRAVEACVMAPSYMRKGKFDPRFVVPGREILRVLGRDT